MKKILTLVCLCLSFSIMSAKGFSVNDSKDVIKQKTEFVKTQDLFQVDQVTIISQEVEKNFKAVSDAVSSKTVMDVRQNSYNIIENQKLFFAAESLRIHEQEPWLTKTYLYNKEKEIAGNIVKNLEKNCDAAINYRI